MKEEFIRLTKENNISGELFQLKSYRLSVDFENNKFKGIDEGETNGFAVRVMKNNKIGFAYSTGKENLKELIELALGSAEFSKEVSFKFARHVDKIPSVQCFDESIVNEDRNVAIELGREFVEFIRSLKDGLQAGFSMQRSVFEESIVTSEGFESTFKKTVKSVSAGGVFTKEGNFLEVSAGEARSLNGTFDLETMKDKLKSNVLAANMNVKVPSGKYPVIFTPFSIGEVLRPLLIALNGQNVLKGFSMLKGKLGQTIFSSELTLIDNPLLSGGAYSFPFDDEGIVSHRKELIAKGQVRNFLADLDTASKLHIYGGNAQRGLSSIPQPSSSNLILQTGSTPFNNMIKVPKKVLIIENLMGTMMGNVIGGFVTGNIELGYLVENGAIVGRVKDVMINFNVFDVLKDIAVSKENIWTDKYIAPYIYLPSVSISSK